MAKKRLPPEVLAYFAKQGKLGSKLGASKGGKARAAKLTPEERSAIAKKASETRWAREKKKRKPK